MTYGRRLTLAECFATYGFLNRDDLRVDTQADFLPDATEPRLRRRHLVLCLVFNIVVSRVGPRLRSCGTRGGRLHRDECYTHGFTGLWGRLMEVLRQHGCGVLTRPVAYAVTPDGPSPRFMCCARL